MGTKETSIWHVGLKKSTATQKLGVTEVSPRGNGCVSEGRSSGQTCTMDLVHHVGNVSVEMHHTPGTAARGEGFLLKGIRCTSNTLDSFDNPRP